MRLIPSALCGLCSGFACALLLLSGCQGIMPGGQPGPRSIKIGAIYPLSGNVANAGTNALNGVKLAVEVLNGQHPDIDLPKLTVGTVELVPVDSQGDPQNGSADVDRLVNNDKVAAIIGAYQSAVTLTASQQADRLGVPFVNGSSGAEDLSNRGLKWFFRTGPTSVNQVTTYLDWLKQIAPQHPVKSVAVIHMNDDFGNDFMRTLRSYVDRYGVSVSDEISFQPNATDLSSQVQKLRADNADAVFATMFINDTVLFLRTMAQLGYTPPALLAAGGGWDDPSFTSSAGQLAENNTRIVPWGLQVTEKNPLAKQVDDLFNKTYGQHLNGDSARTFTAMIVLGQALEAAKSTEPDKIRDALTATNVTRSIMPWAGIKFDNRGQNTLASYLILQLHTGEWQVLFPKELATAEPIWPMPPFPR